MTRTEHPGVVKSRRLKTFILTLFALFAFPLGAQSPGAPDIQSMEKRMNEIKLDENYVFGEGNGSTAKIAYNEAFQSLAMTAITLREQAGKPKILPELILSIMNTPIAYKRANGRFKYFLYISREELMHLGEPAPTAKEVRRKKQEQKQREEARKDSVQGVPDSRPADQAKSRPAPRTNPRKNSYEPVILDIVNRTPLQLTELKFLLDAYKKAGLISRYGQTRPGETTPDGAYVLLFNRQYEIIALLDPRGRDGRTDYIHGVPDSEENHSDYGIIWFQ